MRKIRLCRPRRAGLGLAALLGCGPAFAEPPPIPDGGPRLSAGAGLAPGGRVSGSALDDLGLFDVTVGRQGGALVPGQPQSGWFLQPSLGLTLTGTDNVRNTAGNRRADGYLTLTPAITAGADTSWITGRLTYNPTVRLYAENDRLNDLGHRFSANAHVTLLEDTVFLDLLGFGSVTETAGSLGAQTAAATNSRNSIQTSVLQASPYLLHRFGEDAVLQLGVGLRQMSQDGRSAFLPGSTVPYFRTEQTTSQEVYGVLRSGPNAGPLALQLRGSAVTFSGTGALDGAHKYLTTIEARYAVNRWLAPLVELGYEDQRYGGTNPLTIQDPVWAVGVRITPDADSTIIIRYGRRDGYNSAAVNARLALGVRTTLTARYTDQLGTALQRSADLLTSARTDELGNTVDAETGGALVPPFANSFLATQSTVSRSKRGTIGITQDWARDRLSFSITYDERMPVTSARGTQGFAQKGVTGTLGWLHDFTERTNGGAYLQLGQTERDGSSSLNYSLRLRLSHYLTESLTTWAEYGFSHRDSDLAGSLTVQNYLLIGLRQYF